MYPFLILSPIGSNVYHSHGWLLPYCYWFRSPQDFISLVCFKSHNRICVIFMNFGQTRSFGII